jgi:ABC-type transporter Mla subunit MlaD
MRRGSASIVANPVLVGAVTTLVVVVAVFLAYNANNGLPFVPSRTIFVELPDGAEVNKGVEVREGGFRIGVVEDLKPGKLRNGNVGAILQLKLDETAGPFPRDSQILVRPRAPLALKIIEFDRGRAKEELADGARIPARQTDVATDLDELYNVYDAPTREGTEQQLTGFGTAFIGRGVDLNTTIQNLPRFLQVLEPVMANLSDERTQLPNFFRQLGRFTKIVSPVAEEWAHSFTAQADTFDAINRDPEALKSTISKSPPTMDVSIRSFKVQRPFLRDTAAMSEDLDAAATELRAALPDLNRALEVGTPVTRRSVELNDELQKVMVALRDLTTSPTTNGALRGLTATVTTLQPQLRFLGPYVTGCNYWNIFWTVVGENPPSPTPHEHFSATTPTGQAQRVLLNSGSDQADEVTSFGANEPANGKNMRDPEGIRQYEHYNAYGATTIMPDGRLDCTPGQQGYPYGANKENDDFYKRTAYDQLLWKFPGEAPVKGGTFEVFDREGRGSGQRPPRLPEGQTFTSIPGGRAALTDYDKEFLRRMGRP